MWFQLTNIKNLPCKSSSGHDGISTKILKAVGDELLNPLVILVNQCLKTSTFPDLLKIARVIPLYKKGDNALLDNYRPISLLPAISKVFEKIIFLQLYDYFSDNFIFHPSQYGFRKGHSTEYAAAELIDKIFAGFSEGEQSIALFMDLSKAFDTLDHDILLYKLQHYGLAPQAVSLLKSYLTDRSQYVDFNGTTSDRKGVVTGVPQGSILGPLLFLIYINDISTVSNLFHSIMYADDTSLLDKISKFGSDPSTISKNINIELAMVSEWLRANKLSLNVGKTKFMVFHSSRAVPIQNLHLQIEGTEIEQVSSFSFLGLILNETLSWEDHLQAMATKAARSIGVMSKLKYCLPQNIMLNLYHTLVMSRLNYQLLNWGSHLSWDNERMTKLQKRAVRNITRAPYLAHTEPIFSSLKLPKLEHVYEIIKLRFYFKYSNGNLPSYFQMIPMSRGTDYHSYPTSSRSSIRAPDDFNKPFVERRLQYLIFDLVNHSIPRYVTDKVTTHSYQSFNFYCKTFFINTYSDTCIIQNCYVCNLYQKN